MTFEKSARPADRSLLPPVERRLQTGLRKDLLRNGRYFSFLARK